jgi:hypothetical protein
VRIEPRKFERKDGGGRQVDMIGIVTTLEGLRDLAKSDGNRGVETSGPEVRIFVPKWPLGPDENANHVLPILLKTTPKPSVLTRKRDRDRTERADSASRRPESSRFGSAMAFARQKGEVRTKDLAEIGVPRCYLTCICDEGLLVKIGYGRYRAADKAA